MRSVFGLLFAFFLHVMLFFIICCIWKDHSDAYLYANKIPINLVSLSASREKKLLPKIKKNAEKKDENAKSLFKKIPINHPKKNVSSSSSRRSNDKKTKFNLLNLLHAAIAAQQVYPEEAIIMHQTGSAKISFTVYPDGHVSNIDLSKSTGVRLLDRAAMAAVKAAFPIKIDRIALNKAHKFSVEIKFEI